MSNPVYFLHAARIDLRKAFEWYEFQDPGLGDRLLLSIHSALERCSENPLAFAVFSHPFRRMRVDIFPYLVFFSIDGEKIVVHAVFHTSRNPNVLKSRLRRGLP